jgi:hypothetical protein
VRVAGRAGSDSRSHHVGHRRVSTFARAGAHAPATRVYQPPPGAVTPASRRLESGLRAAANGRRAGPPKLTPVRVGLQLASQRCWGVVQWQDTWLWTTVLGFESLLPSQSQPIQRERFTNHNNIANVLMRPSGRTWVVPRPGHRVLWRPSDVPQARGRLQSSAPSGSHAGKRRGNSENRPRARRQENQCSPQKLAAGTRPWRPTPLACPTAR